ncbi:two-component sensor histidine kinase [Propioniciclava sinopodophylli]|uniref:histidine kinase n=1 Tax=Propioniciclava sinopodophylli TaxID=1837344 RepID=A0A4Q9KAK0_9ACTN|nr:histidine kinase [Propioniciclava sinopodophylli]TBT82497.1 two-component sensor histidine kinase [Propioniciclava sinopodophylli]
MTAPPLAPAPPRVVVWTVAVLAFLYYLTPIAARLAAGRPLPWSLVLLLVLPAIAALVALPWRERAPIAIALVIAALWVPSPGVLGAAIVAQESVARRRSLTSALTTGAVLIAAKVLELFASASGAAATAISFELALAIAGVVIATLVGLLASSRAQAQHDRESAEQARREAEASRINEARMAERERIAREMHDVVAHRLSLVALHAGGLVYRTNLTADEAQAAARMIQLNAQASLDELRTMLATLRGSEAPPEPPQPTLAELDVLLADAEDIGQLVTVTHIGDLEAVATHASRQSFRIVQECLTNARKHAPGAPVHLSLTARDEVLHLRVSNPLADLAIPDASGSRLGLVGIAERVGLVGGTLTHGVRDGQFVVDAALPWGAPAKEGA